MSHPRVSFVLGGFLLAQIFLPTACKWASADQKTVQVQSVPMAPLAKAPETPKEEPKEEVIQTLSEDAKVVSEQTPPPLSESGTSEAEDPASDEEPGAVAVKMAY